MIRLFLLLLISVEVHSSDDIITDYTGRIEKVPSLKCKRKENFFEGKCIKIPKHAIASDSIPGWICKRGYVQKRSRCIKIDLPPHSHLSPDGKSWECDEGFQKYRSTCVK